MDDFLVYSTAYLCSIYSMFYAALSWHARDAHPTVLMIRTVKSRRDLREGRKGLVDSASTRELGDRENPDMGSLRRFGSDWIDLLTSRFLHEH